MKNTPVGVAQKKVLDALGITANDWLDANKKFDEIGIMVGSKRVGNSSEPVITVKETDFGGWNPGGDGESFSTELPDLSAVKQWIK